MICRVCWTWGRSWGGTPANRLEQAEALDVEAWLEERGRPDGETEDVGERDWPDPPLPPHRLGAHCDVLSGSPLDEVCIARLPSPESWKAPCLVGMGGWNECPGPDVLSVFARRWHLRYGAEVVSTTHDVLEFTVATPPSTREAALELAREQYLLCPDIVEQGCGSVAALAWSPDISHAFCCGGLSLRLATKAHETSGLACWTPDAGTSGGIERMPRATTSESSGDRIGRDGAVRGRTGQPTGVGVREWPWARGCPGRIPARPEPAAPRRHS